MGDETRGVSYVDARDYYEYPLWFYIPTVPKIHLKMIHVIIWPSLRI